MSVACFLITRSFRNKFSISDPEMGGGKSYAAIKRSVPEANNGSVIKDRGKTVDLFLMTTEAHLAFDIARGSDL